MTTPDGRIRVLHLVDRLDDSGGGGERTALSLAVSLPSERFDVWMCTTRIAGGGPVADLAAGGVRHVHLDRHGRVGVAGLVRLARLIARLRPDVVHAHMFGSNVWGAVFGRGLKVPAVVAHEQTWSYEGRPVRRLLDRHVIGRLAHAFVAVSSADAERMQRLERVPPHKVRMIANAWFERPPSVADLRAELGLALGVPVAATVAVMRPQKRLDLLVDAFGRTLERVPGAHLVLVGDGPERGAVEARIRTLGLEDAVHLTGTRQDVDAVWRAADAMVLSSDFEGTPLAVLEAMAAGVPVVSTDVGGLRDIVAPESAVLVARRDPAALGAALARVLADPALRKRMGEAGRTRAGQFTAATHAARFASLYEELLQGSPGSSR